MFREKPPEEKLESYNRLLQMLADFGADPDTVKPEVLARMRLLAETTETVRDCERAVAIAERVFARRAERKPAEAFTDLEKRTVALGSLFSDIGKTGPAGAAPEEQKIIAEMYAVEEVPFKEIATMTVADFFRRYFPADAEERIRAFNNLALDPQTLSALKDADIDRDPSRLTMRQFYDLHSFWTLDIIHDDGVPAEAVGAAATHHLLDLADKRGRIQLDRIVGGDNRFLADFGENLSFDRAEKLVTILDKYDAARRRGKLSHADAITRVDTIIAESPRFADDEEFKELLSDLAAAGDPFLSTP